MKIIFVIAVFVTFVVDSMALKNAICGLPYSQDGDGITGCLALNRNWSYISRKNICVDFDYGGCGGNDNNFTTKEECENKCLE
ncbi:male accessory gland serine protease inhibitor-like [Drosophila subpulchrella]|uniref:male accessory gland serine protease inhibitor-like n=1 Tax=Drosophila subpulchrella TaxID=1486046 RepID=UPI0018A12738|nr:male accessory gland serine protease inhibitor-like [Drosophila subpulchrella]